MDVNQRKILVDEVQKIEWRLRRKKCVVGTVYSRRDSIVACNDHSVAVRHTVKVVVPFIPGGRGVQVGRYLAHDPITVAEVSVHPES